MVCYGCPFEKLFGRLYMTGDVVVISAVYHRLTVSVSTGQDSTNSLFLIP